MRILVIRFSSLGDVILTTPVLAALRERHPQAHITYLVMDTCADAIEGNPHIDEVIRFDKTRHHGLLGLRAFARRLGGFDLIIDLHAKLRSRIITGFVPGRVLRYRKRVWWKAIGVHLRLIRYRADAPIVTTYFNALTPLGIPMGQEALNFSFSKADSRRVEAHVGAVVLAIGAANATKKWPAEHFARLGELLAVPVVVIGGSADRADGEAIRQHIGSRCTNLAGDLSLKESGALLAAARYVICNDSVSFHMARAVGTRAFVIFGPTDPGMFTYNDRAVLIYRDEPCAPCSLHGDRLCPKGHFNCMRKLMPEAVLERITNQHPSTKAQAQP